MITIRRVYVLAFVSFLVGVVVVVGGIPAYVIGLIAGNLQTYQNIFRKESLVLEKVLESNAEFSQVHAYATSQGMCDLASVVPSDEECFQLKAAVEREFGRTNLDSRMRMVEE